jgi:hypothetical protein
MPKHAPLEGAVTGHPLDDPGHDSRRRPTDLPSGGPGRASYVTSRRMLRRTPAASGTATRRGPRPRSAARDPPHSFSSPADVIDPTSVADVQVATIKVEINAAAGHLDQLASKAKEAGAGWGEHSEDI